MGEVWVLSGCCVNSWFPFVDGEASPPSQGDPPGKGRNIKLKKELGRNIEIEIGNVEQGHALSVSNCLLLQKVSA
jgi:hypothetical protein